MLAFVFAVLSAGLQEPAPQDLTPPPSFTRADGLSSQLIARPHFVRLPKPSRFRQFYPDKAQALHQTGRAVVFCKVLRSGALTACEVASETPEGFGFGAAALKLASDFQVSPADIPCAEDVCACVRLPILFQIAEDRR
jgi:TonB family protein